MTPIQAHLPEQVLKIQTEIGEQIASMALKQQLLYGDY